MDDGLILMYAWELMHDGFILMWCPIQLQQTSLPSTSCFTVLWWLDGCLPVISARGPCTNIANHAAMSTPPNTSMISQVHLAPSVLEPSGLSSTYVGIPVISCSYVARLGLHRPQCLRSTSRIWLHQPQGTIPLLMLLCERVPIGWIEC